jgi:hypothetical protein
MARTDLSLGNLYRAVSGSVRTSQQVSISGLNGGGSNISMLNFATDAITVTAPTYTYIVESTTENAQFSFSLTGSNFFNKVQQQFNNYTCSFSNANFTTGSKTVTSGSTVFPITAASIGTTVYAEASSSFTMSYADGYNTAATNYNTRTTKLLYAVDVYNTINQPDFCLLFGTKIQLSDGTELNVEDLVVGDEIKAWVPDGLPDETLDGTDTAETEWRFFLKDELSGTTQNVVIADLTFNFASSYYSINNGLIEATGLHPLYVWDNEIQKYKFKNIENILIGDRLINENQTEIEITNIDKINSDVEIVTVNVEQSDVYLSNGFISHNKGTTTQPYIPANGLKMYLEPGKSGSWAANAFPTHNTAITVDLMDMSGNNTGVRPGAQAPLSFTNGSPVYISGSLRKERYLKFDGGDALYKDTVSISGGIANFNTNSGSIHVWIKPNATLGAASKPIFDYRGSYVLLVSSSNSSAVDRVGISGSLGNFSATTSSLASGSWYMVSATFQSNGTSTLYVDGTSVGSFTSTTFANPTTANYLVIGANTGRNIAWSGSIGPVLFYNLTQDSTLVKQVYDYFSPNYK